MIMKYKYNTKQYGNEQCCNNILIFLRLKLGNSNVPYKKVLDEIKSQPSWPPLSSTKLADGKRTASDINIDTRKAVLQLENVEILDENYIKKYFGSGGSVTNSIVAPVSSDTLRY